MAKRKRLTIPPATFSAIDGAHPDTQTTAARRAPIADVAREATATSALQQVAQELNDAKSQGRMIQALPLGRITTRHLVRDRLFLDNEDMAALKQSLKARGQQTPIEVTETSPGQYGLISGFRRLQALKELHAETPMGPFGTVLALIRQPKQASDAYIAMVEENEVRANLSYYERASIVRAAVREGVFPNETTALQQLFAAASRSKRSKIKSFLPIIEQLGAVLHFPTALTERLGLALATRCVDDPAFAGRLKDRLRKSAFETADMETQVLTKALGDKPTSARAPQTLDPKPPVMGPWSDAPRADVSMRFENGQLQLSGTGVTKELSQNIAQYLRNTAD
ncbi:MAG: ParB N-terminal domain-containing protein [Pseudomonadota bacterium]